MAAKKPAWPDPTDTQLANPIYDPLWEVIKTWDIAVPGAYEGTTGATSNHVAALLNGLPDDLVRLRDVPQAPAADDASKGKGKVTAADATTPTVLGAAEMLAAWLKTQEPYVDSAVDQFHMDDALRMITDGNYVAGWSHLMSLLQGAVGTLHVL